MMMSTKDWVILILPIFLNGIFLFIFQKILAGKIDHINERNSIRNKVLILFWEKSKRFNDTLIRSNINIQQGNSCLNIELQKIEDEIVLLFQYYDTNSYDLDVVKNEYDALRTSWNKFVEVLKKYHGNEMLTKDMQMDLGNKLQAVKDNTKELIKACRDQY